MKIVFIVEYVGDFSVFYQLGELLVEGWVLGKLKFSVGQLIELVYDVEVLVISYDEVMDVVMVVCLCLQVIVCICVNLVNIDIQVVQVCGIWVFYILGCNVDVVVELMFGLMFSLVCYIL